MTSKPGMFSRFPKWNARHPVLAILLVAGLAVLINCYPVIFCGKSYVSPACFEPLVYNWGVPLPEMNPATSQISRHGSDTAAMMVWGVPVGFIESRSLLEQGELPLWNRYGHAGDTLVGQALSMLGDPLQWVVILGHGSAGAWDVKFVVAKFILCAGFGLLTLRLLGSRPLSLMFAALAAYCGAFFFINNHPAFFVFCYAPWVLLSALAWLNLESDRHIRWGAAWLLVNFACFNGGHIELSVVLIGGLNLAAVVYGLICRPCILDRARVLGRMIMAVLFFLGLTAPMWVSFLVTMQEAYSAHLEVQVQQMPPAALLGIFDDLFNLLLRRNETVAALAPGASLLVLTGCILAALHWRQSKREPFFWVNAGAICLWGGVVYGWVPAFILEAIPLLNRVGHTYTDFSYLVIIHLTLLSAYGFKSLAQEKNLRRVSINFACVAAVFGALILAYSLGTMHRPVPWNYFCYAAIGAIGAPWLFACFRSRTRSLSPVVWLAILILGFIPNYRFGLYHAGNDTWLLVPGPRAVLNAPSPSVAKLQAENSDPFRVVGLASIFFGDYSAVYSVEDIRSCAPLSNGQYMELLQKSPGVKLDQSWVIYLADLTAAQPLLNLLNVKYLLVHPDIQFHAAAFGGFKIAGQGDFLVLENLQAWPRAFFTDKVVANDSTAVFLQQLAASSKKPLAAVASDIVARHADLSALQGTRTATVVPATNYLLLPNSTAFDIHAPSAGVVCLTEGQAKDFTATANGEPKAVMTVNRAFKGIYIKQPGDYHIQFTYRPRYWRPACISFWSSVSLAVALMLAGEICAHRRLKAKLNS